MDHYFLRRSTNDGVRTHIKYFTGDPYHMVTADLARDWADYPDDIQIAVMDSVLASSVLEYVKRIDARNPDVVYDVASQANIQKISQHLTELEVM